MPGHFSGLPALRGAAFFAPYGVERDVHGVERPFHGVDLSFHGVDFSLRGQFRMGKRPRFVTYRGKKRLRGRLSGRSSNGCGS